MSLQAEAATVDDELGALVHTHLDVVLDTSLVRGADHRAVVGRGIGGDADAQACDGGLETRPQLGGGALAHRHHDRQRHAALPGGAVGRA